MLRIVKIITIGLTGFLVIASAHANVQEIKKTVCTGIYKGNKRPTPEELSTILQDHLKWLGDEKKRTRANLCGANLQKANLRKAQLGLANLSQADLLDADLSQANLLSADLSKANLRKANLRGAYLGRANLSEANLLAADLREANLWSANLSKANLAGADLASSFFEVGPGFLPPIQSFAFARNLSRMAFLDTPYSLVELRERFKKAGLRRQEREITYAIKHTERIKTWKGGIWEKVESLFYFIFFELTSAYGMFPGRPLILIGFLALILSPPYMLVIAFQRSGRAGIWVVWLQDRVLRDEGGSRPLRMSGSFPFPKLQKRFAGTWCQSFLRFSCIASTGVYFSILSAFRIGWRELTVANWLSSLQPREYILLPTGWVRFVSGLQSVISVYLLALWVVTYFGRPFE